MKSCTLHAKKKVIQRNPISKFTDSFKSLTLGPSANNHGTGEEKQLNIWALSRAGYAQSAIQVIKNSSNICHQMLLLRSWGYVKWFLIRMTMSYHQVLEHIIE